MTKHPSLKLPAMSGSKCNTMLAGSALVLSAGWVLAWAIGLSLDSGSWPTRMGLLGGGLALAGGSAALLIHLGRRNRREVERHFDALCRFDPRAPPNSGALTDLPPLPPRNPWTRVAGRVREAFLQCCQRFQELEHSGTVSEIHRRRAATQYERINSILSGLVEPILAVDDYDELLLANRSAQQLFQLDAERLEARTLNQLVRCQKLIELLTRASHRKTHGQCTDEVEIVDADGNARWYRVTASKLAASAGASERQEPGPHGEPCDPAQSAGAVAVLRDIGDQKVLQKRNAEFVSAVSHEMKTPLAGIKAYVELLVDGDAEDEETREKFLQVINGQADRLQRLVDNMLNLARIEAGVVQVNKRTRPLNELLEEALRVVQPAAEAKQIDLVGDLSPMYLGVLADRDMLLQAAINLLSNAIKYTPEVGQVTMRSRLEGDQVRFEVQDTGVGLSEEDCRRIFEKFYRVKKDAGMASGTGLGLPLAKHIVEDVHGGQLWAESTLGEGSTFAVTLPSAGQLG